MPNRYRYAVELLRFQENDRVTKDCWSLLEIENLEWLKHFELSKNKKVYTFKTWHKCQVFL